MACFKEYGRKLAIILLHYLAVQRKNAQSGESNETTAKKLAKITREDSRFQQNVNFDSGHTVNKSHLMEAASPSGECVGLEIRKSRVPF